MGAEIEWIVGVLRMGKEFEASVTRDKYDFSGTVVRDGDALLIKGFTSVTASRVDREALRKELQAHGIKVLRWEHRGKLHEEPV